MQRFRPSHRPHSATPPHRHHHPSLLVSLAPPLPLSLPSAASSPSDGLRLTPLVPPFPCTYAPPVTPFLQRPSLSSAILMTSGLTFFPASFLDQRVCLFFRPAQIWPALRQLSSLWVRGCWLLYRCGFCIPIVGGCSQTQIHFDTSSSFTSIVCNSCTRWVQRQDRDSLEFRQLALVAGMQIRRCQ